MKFKKRLGLAFGMLKNAKLRSWLTIIGIVIAVASVTMILSFGEGIKTEVNNKVGGSGAKTLELYPGWSEEGSTHITINDYEELEQLPEVSSLLKVISTYSKITYLDIENSKNIKGFDLENFDDFKSTYKLKEGEWIEDGVTGKLMVSFDYLNRSFGDDDKPELYDYLEIYGEQYQIIGIFESGGMFDFSGDEIITSYQDVVDIMKLEENLRIDEEESSMYYELNLPAGVNEDDVYEQIKIKVNPDIEFNKAKTAIEERLIETRNSDREDKNFWLSSKDAMLNELNKIVNIVTWVLVGFASISILVGSVGIANTMFTSVLEKTKEIGIMKSIGAKDKDIRSIFILNSGLLGLAGGIIGILIGMGLALIAGVVIIHYAQIDDISLWNLISFKVIFGSLLFSMLIGMASGFLPAKNAARMKPVDALRFE